MTSRTLGGLCAVALAAVVAAPATADEHTAKVEAYLASDVTPWLGASEIVTAVEAQNVEHAALADAEIEALDQKWRAEKKAGSGELMASKIDNALSDFLRDVRDRSGGKVAEIFVMDNRGLNVGQTDPTGDYMQGDEDKWQKTYQVGAGATFIDAVEEDGGKNISQASATIVDASGAPIGAVTIALDVDALK